MKIIFALLLTTLVILSCNDEKVVIKQTYRDTTFPLAIYLGYGKVGVEQDVVRKVTIHDTLMWDISKDTMEAKKKVRDSIYYEGFMNISVRDSITMRALGLKKMDTIVRRLLFIQPAYLREFPNYESSMKELRALMDTTKPKIDTAKK